MNRIGRKIIELFASFWNYWQCHRLECISRLIAVVLAPILLTLGGLHLKSLFNGEAFLFLAVPALGVSLWQRSFRIATLQKPMLWGALLGMGYSYALILSHLHDPSQIGAGVALLYLTILYAGLLVEAPTGFTALLVLACHVTLPLCLIAIDSIYRQNRSIILLWPALSATRLLHLFSYTLACLLAGWALHGSRGYLSRLPQLATASMVLLYVQMMINLAGVDQLRGAVIYASLPLVLCLITLGRHLHLKKVPGEQAQLNRRESGRSAVTTA